MNRDFYKFEVSLATSWSKLGKLLWGQRYFRPRGFKIAGASAPVAPAVPTPLQKASKAEPTGAS